jgi:putative transposase
LSGVVPIVFLCVHFKVSRSGYYAWANREYSLRTETHKKHIEFVKEAFKTSKGRYGSPRIVLQLRAEGVSISVNTVAKIMNIERLIARKKKAFKVVTLAENISDDVHERLFKIEDYKNLEANEVWAGDITYLPVDNKFFISRL